MNGQIASGEVNRYRFEARKGQRLVISAQARQLIPYIADAVPGWFQPVLALCDANGKEVAYDDDYRFKPDPVDLSARSPRTASTCSRSPTPSTAAARISSIAITIGELPFVTSIFPLGGRVGEPAKIEMKGWNLETAELTPPAEDAKPGRSIWSPRADGRTRLQPRAVRPGHAAGMPRQGSPTTTRRNAQKVKLPIIVNGRTDRPDDWDVFQSAGQAGETIVAEVYCAPARFPAGFGAQAHRRGPASCWR